MPLVESIAVRRFKRLVSIETGLETVTALVGANNSGKTSLLQAVHFAVAAAQSGRIYGDAEWDGDTFQCTLTVDELHYLPTHNLASLGNGGMLGGRPDDGVEVCLKSATSECIISVFLSSKVLLGVRVTGRILGEQVQALESPFTVFAPGLAGISRFERLLGLGVVRRAVARGDANLVLRNVLYHLSLEAASWPQFLDSMRSVFPGLEIDIRFRPDLDENIEVMFSLPECDPLPIESAGTGVLQACQLFSYIELFSPRLLILDEPDSHLHPNNQRSICSMLAELAKERGFQVMLGTHSRHVVDALGTESRLLWISNGAIAEESESSLTSLFLELGALDSIDLLLGGDLKVIVATEDSDTTALRVLLQQSGFNLDETHILPYAGCTKVDVALAIFAFLRDRGCQSRFVVHRDRDYLTEPEIAELGARFTKAGADAFFTVGLDIESHFLTAEHISAVHADLDVARAGELLEQATLESREESYKKLVRARTDESLRAHRDGGPPVDPGEIAVQAQNEYEADPVMFRHGKTVLKRLNALLQDELSSRVGILVSSNHLSAPELERIAQEAWRPPTPSESEDGSTVGS